MNLRQLFLVAIFVFATIIANAESIILDPVTGPGTTTVNGIVNLRDFDISNGTITAYAPNYSNQASLSTDGEFTLLVPVDSVYTLQTYLYYSGYNGYNRLSRTNNPPLAEGETATMNLQWDAELIKGRVNVTGGEVTNMWLNFSGSNSANSESFYGYSSDSLVYGDEIVPTFPMPSGTTYSVYGYAYITNINGCEVQRSLSTQYVELLEGTSAEVEWSVDVSSETCDRGNLTGTVELNNVDPGLIRRNYIYITGPEYRSVYLSPGESFNFTDLKEGRYYLYAYTYFYEPYSYYRHANSYLEVVGGQVTTHNIVVDAGLFESGLDFVGPWDANDVPVSLSASGRWGTPAASSYSYDSIDPQTGKLNFVLGEGTWDINGWYANFHDNANGRYTSQSISNYYSDFMRDIIVESGSNITLPNKEIQTSESLVSFQLAQEVDSPEILLGYMYIYGSAQQKDADGNYLGASYIDLYSWGTAVSNIMFSIRGVPGIYSLKATAYGTDGRQYQADFTLEMGTPLTVETGTDVIQTVSDEVSLTFDNVLVSGETTLSELTLGPPSPEGFVIYGPTGDPLYFDISTTAVFDGSVEICVQYDDSGLNSGQERTLELGHYVCDADNLNCTWETITSDGYPDVDTNTLCGTTSSFSYFAILQKELVDTDGDEILDDVDNCPATANPDQSDMDNDGIGDACDLDSDGDGLTNDVDLCPNFVSSINTDMDGDGIGDVCDSDKDGDTIANDLDNCPSVANSDQANFDGDANGDLCDLDDDNDGIADALDKCEMTPLEIQVDTAGCSSTQRFVLYCPADGEYRNHGQYVTCIVEEATTQIEIGLLSSTKVGKLVSAAARSDIGKKDPEKARNRVTKTKVHRNKKKK